MDAKSALRLRKENVASSKNDDLGVGIPEQNRRLLSWRDIPSWQRDNEYIISGYRPVTESLWQCVRGLGYTHNETGEYIR